MKKIINLLLSLLPIKLNRNIRFFKIHGYFPSYTSPKTFSEKINKIIVCKNDSKLTFTCDKLKNKDKYSKIKNLNHANLLLEFDQITNLKLNFDGSWVLKSNNSSNQILFGKGKIDEIRAIKIWNQIKNWDNIVQTKFLGEWPYEYAKKSFFIEENIAVGDSYDKSPIDYKFFVASGKILCIQVDSSRFTNHTRNFYDENWNKVDLTVQYPNGPEDLKPNAFLEMKQIALEIASEFNFMRVDLYYENSKIWFGEITPFPGSGLEKFSSRKYELQFGNEMKNL